MSRLIIIVGVQVYACALAFAQILNGVRTDEAKYLLNIPYPHPPLARWILGVFDGFAWQEYAARILFATLMVQAVWIVWDMGRALKMSARLSLAVIWLGSAAFVLQAGTIMMAPLTALQALVFLWMLSLPQERLPSVATIAFFWLLTLFTALQGILLAPLAVAVLQLKGERWGAIAWYIGAPLVLVALYALGNPLILASFGVQASKDAGSTFAARGEGLLWVLMLAGSGIGAVTGIVGLALKRHWFIMASFVLLCAYVFLGRFDYYAILFLPFFITGAKHLFRRAPTLGMPAGLIMIACTVLMLIYHVPLVSHRSSAREALRIVGPGRILLSGSIGHEWQYEVSSAQELLRYNPALEDEADGIVCTDICPAMGDSWEELPVDSQTLSIGIWRRRPMP